MGFRYTLAKTERLFEFLAVLPTSVKVVGSLGCGEIGTVAFVLESPHWPDDPADHDPMRQVVVKVDDRAKALTRTVTIEEVSPIVGAGAKGIILPGNG